MNATTATRLDALCDTLGASYTRTPLADGGVRITLALPSGDALGGSGLSTADAVDALIEKAQAFGLVPPAATE